MNLRTKLGHISRSAVLILSLLGVCLVGLIDYVTGEELSIIVLYLGPVALVTWRSGRSDGFLIALACSLAWLFADLATHHHYSQGFVPYWNSLMLLTFFLVVVHLLSALKVSYAGLEIKVQERTVALQSEVAERRRAEDRLIDINAQLTKSREELIRTLDQLQKSHAELKSTQLQLIESAKLELVGRLAAGVAHEVKNPLTTITMVGDYLANFVPQDDESKLMLIDLREAVQRANRVVSELLEYSRPRGLLIREEDLHAIIDRCLGMLKLELTKAKVNVVRELAPGMPLLPLDKNKIEQVLINLFLNAIQAMPAGGTLSIRTRLPPAPGISPGDCIQVEIDDTGIGIPPSNLSRLFDPFFTTKPPGTGTGLGLSVVRQIMQMHDGSIEINNRPEGGVRVALGLKNKPSYD